MAVAPVGLLVIRVWAENGSERPLRAQLRVSVDTTLGFERTLTLCDPEEVEAEVRAWLDEMLDGGSTHTLSS